MTTIFEHPNELLDGVGQSLGHTEWMEMTQERINLFAEATGDQIGRAHV